MPRNLKATVVSQKKVLMISVAYYPSSVTGAHRGGKFAKYLRVCGWEPVILTVREEFYHEWSPLVDEKLREQIPMDAKLIRTGCFWVARFKHFLPGLYAKAKRSRVLARAAGGKRQQEPDLSSWIEVPDLAFWIPYGLWHGLRAARECDVIWATSPSTGALCAGAILSRLTRRPLVVDLRRSVADRLSASVCDPIAPEAGQFVGAVCPRNSCSDRHRHRSHG